MRIRRRLKRGGVELIVVHQPDGSFACLPAWMTHETASRFAIGMAPAFSLTTLRTLRVELRPKQKAELAATVEALLREIAAALAKAANRESGNDEDHG